MRILEDPDGLPRFEREAKAVSTLLHKNIVALYGFGLWRNTPYMVMEFVDGRTLDEVLSEPGRIQPERAAALTMQILEGLGCAHAHGIVHRDVKPSNIMIFTAPDGKETAKLIDF